MCTIDQGLALEEQLQADLSDLAAAEAQGAAGAEADSALELLQTTSTEESLCDERQAGSL